MSDSARIDKWLFCARFYRSRALALAERRGPASMAQTLYQRLD
jgi:ribosomal 50S subunit-recycling heat shock protein